MTPQPVVGAIQLVATRGDKEANLQAIEHHGAAAARDGAMVVITPEMAVTGYCWPDEDEVRGLAEPLDGPSVRRLTRLAELTGALFVVGLPELDRNLGTLHNTCVLVGPGGCEGAYRKIHPFIADPLWAVDGNALPPVWATPAGRVAPAICADIDYPESSRYAALAGADWLAVPTAWVDEPGPSATWRLRAWENALPMVIADMAGNELGVQFSGGTAVLDHCGRPRAAMDAGVGHLTTTIDIVGAAAARRARLAARRPEEYRALALSRRWPRRSTEQLFDVSPSKDRVRVGVLAAPPGEVPALPADVDLAVLPAFHLCGGPPTGRQDAELAAGQWLSTLGDLQKLAARHRCELVTALVEPAEGGRLHHTVVGVDPEGSVVKHRATHLGAHRSWATAGDGELTGRSHARHWGRLGLLAGEELEPFEPSRVLALRDADVLVVPSAVSWPWPVPHPGTEVPLATQLRGPDTDFAHPVRLRAGDSHVWIAFANSRDRDMDRTPGGIFGPDHVRMPRAEVLAKEHGWAATTCTTRSPDELGEFCETKPQLVRRRPDLLAEPLIVSRNGGEVRRCR
ncbi:MAG: nitrilase-related carbon-nitrogen hydrolase [Nocardioidaceae bacterium]